jgi:hypothetical protein
LTQVEFSGPPGGEPGGVRHALLCPACLSDSLSEWRRKGGVIEARLDGGRVVRWQGPGA